MPCCIGVRPVIGLSATGTLLPLLFFLTSVVQPCISVCIHCKDTILPAHESANCPLASDIASNVDLFSTGTLGSIPKVTNLLPPPILRMFPKAALEAMVGFASAPANGVQIDFTTAQYTSSANVVKAAFYGHCTHEEACMELQTRLDAAEDELAVSKIARSIELLSKNSASGVASSMQGVYTYMWARISSFVTAPSFDVARLTMEDAASKMPASGMVAKLVRPKSINHFFEMLHVFIFVVVSVGLASFTHVMTFVNEVVHGSMRDLKIKWETAHELLLIYLKVIENDAQRLLHFGNVFRRGCHDTYLHEAKVNVAAFFRTVGGKPSDGIVEHNGKFNKNTDKCCVAFNKGLPCEHLDADGTCKYNHVCMQWVSNKGVNGRCMGNHPMAECTSKHKLDKALKA